MTTEEYAGGRYRVRIHVLMERTAGANELEITGAHDLDGALALINAGLEVFICLERHGLITLPAIRAVVAQLPERFEKAASDPTRPILAALPAADG